MIPFGPGGFADITLRLLAQKLTERTGAQVVIENRPGAGARAKIFGETARALYFNGA